MNIKSLTQRAEKLEKEHAGPMKVRLIWYSDKDYGQGGHNRIKLRWLDDMRL